MISTLHKESAPAHNRVRRIVLLAALVCGISLMFMYREAFALSSLQVWTRNAGSAGPIVFILFYALSTVLLMPGSLPTLAGGALFGPLWGTLYNLTGATLGATLAFLLARYLGGAWVQKRTTGRIEQLKQGVQDEGWRFVAFVRLVPLFPFNLLNYGLGLTRLKLWHYVVTSYVCMLPASLAYTYVGYAGSEAMGDGEGWIQKGLLALGLVVTLAFLPRVIARFRERPVAAH